MRGSDVNKKKVSFRKFLAVRCDAGAGQMHCFKVFSLEYWYKKVSSMWLKTSFAFDTPKQSNNW